MAASAYAQLLTALGPKSASGFIAALEEHGVYVIDSGDDPIDLNAGNILAILFNGVIFWYDPADSTSVHDGVSVIVTAEGRRYKSDQYRDASSHWFAPLDKDLATPPVTPALGDVYIVAAAATGTWTGHSKKIAIWTAREWVFIQPKPFDYAYVRDEALIYHYSAAGVWTSGIPAITISDASISHKKFKYFPLGIAIENQTTNTPPGSPADGVAYIVGGSPTGAWVGHSLDVAIFEGSSWQFYDPYEGAHLYDKLQNNTIIFNGSIWTSSTSGYISVSSQFTAADLIAATNYQSQTSYTYDATVAPTTSDANDADTATLAYAAKKSGAVLEITYECGFSFQGTAADIFSLVFGLQVDSNSTMSDWAIAAQDAIQSNPPRRHFSQTFFITTADANSHTYGIRGFGKRISGSGNSDKFSISRRRIIIRERT